MQYKSSLLAPLFKILEEIKPLREEIQVALLNNFHEQKIKKGTILLHEGDVCKKLWFLADGLLRSYHTIGHKEITSRIMFRNHIVIAPGSFFTQTPATESIEALADCIVVALSFANLQDIYAAFPEFNYHTRIITEQYFYKQEQRLYMLRKHDAAAKYNYFLENYADYLKEIPQKYIASFLNIAPETLSRTRSKLSKGK
ncbi:MAG: Crp/Fnr family transcriptional regulator [Chitinophagaceae bacterium]|nr:Crp/Fnr family transcriptional regulator [Chitinophagaceae bacterium]